MLRIPKKIVAAIMEQARKEAPLESCGYLAGKDGNVKKHYEMTNVDASSEHFTLDPKEQFDVARKARDNGMDLLAVYHSHPNTPARPSEEDIKLAFDPNITYVIASLENEEEDVKAFLIKDGQVEKKELEVIDDQL